jgi:hypothetical protein
MPLYHPSKHTWQFGMSFPDQGIKLLLLLLVLRLTCQKVTVWQIHLCARRQIEIVGMIEVALCDPALTQPSHKDSNMARNMVGCCQPCLRHLMCQVKGSAVTTCFATAKSNQTIGL